MIKITMHWLFGFIIHIFDIAVKASPHNIDKPELTGHGHITRDILAASEYLPQNFGFC